ncbi:hypothetical protein CFIMG_007512RA00001 [Ceratocystis fimbriata CBS 114723]|uniref:Uncharacterized protein n=1 Tax=Ceratocystis fimbriata CBS 114723 TaxID=1035309 RepID=A0A2C5WWK1_9PEZI|nr:hypothetical protein CFIMG_007512RA00001 [Ceratocystis fimbriata CBS 114723]
MPGVPSAEAPKLMPDGMTISSRMLNGATDIAVKKYGSLEEVDNETVSSVITSRSAFGDGNQLRDDISSRRSLFAKPIFEGRSVSHNVPSRRVWSEQVRIPTPQGNDHMNDRRVFTNAEPNKATYSGGFEDA